MKTTFEKLLEFADKLPENQNEIYYRTQIAEFICGEIDKLKNKTEVQNEHRTI